MHSKFVQFEPVDFTINVGLRSLRGDKKISNFLTFNKNIAVILHALFENNWKKKPILKADHFTI